MAVYKYKATGPGDSSVKGLVEAPNEAIAAEILKEKNLKIVSITEKSGNFDLALLISRVSAKDLVIFSRQFSVLVGSSVSIVQSLKMLANQIENPKFKMIIGEVSADVDGGVRLSDALQKHSDVFSEFFVNVIRSGESSGKLEDVLNYLADELEKDYDMTSKIKGAMIYPAFVFTAMMAVGAVMMIVVVPKLTGIMEETGMELPMATKAIIAISDFLTAYWPMLIVAVIGSFFGFKYVKKIPIGKKIFDIISLKLPIFGKLFRTIHVVRFSRSIQTLLVGGVHISKSLDITAKVVNNIIYKDLIMRTKTEVEDGNSMSTVFATSPYIPDMVSQMISIGEKTGKLDDILSSIAKFYGREIDSTVANLMTLMEPIIMVTMGLAVGVMVAAIIMPMYNMGSAM